MESLKTQDGGLLRTLYANALVMANLTLSDPTCSDETKELIEQIKKQTQYFYGEIEESSKEINIPDNIPAPPKIILNGQFH